SLGSLMVSQVNQLAGDFQRYQSTLREKIHSLRAAAAATGTLERASEVLQDLSSELDKPNRTTTPRLGADSTTVAKPIPVEVRQRCRTSTGIGLAAVVLSAPSRGVAVRLGLSSSLLKSCST